MRRITIAMVGAVAVFGALLVPTVASAATPVPTKTVYLTFDDGPTAGYTQEVLADLKAGGAHATFFEVGIHMSANKAIMRQLLASGNQLGTHSWDHPEFWNLSRAKAKQEINKARDLQIQITGHDSRLFRYPFFQNSTVADSVLANEGLLAVYADIQPTDWMPSTSDADLINQVMTTVQDGSVIDLHDGFEGATRDSGHPGYLPVLLKDLSAAGYAYATIPNHRG